jgi:hypothetical protein
MNQKLFSCLFMMAAIAIINNSLYAQCELPKPTGSHNICSASFPTAISNTLNTLTITNAGTVPPDGPCSVTLTWFDENIGTCGPPMNCTGTLSSTGTTMNLSLSGCPGLPDLPNTGIFYLNINTDSSVYFYHVYNYACGYVLGEGLSTLKAEKLQPAGKPAINVSTAIESLQWGTAICPVAKFERVPFILR